MHKRRPEMLWKLAKCLPRHIADFSRDGTPWQLHVAGLHIGALELVNASLSVDDFNGLLLTFLDQTRVLLRKRLADERYQHLVRLASTVQEAVMLGDSQQEWGRLRRLMRYGGPDRKFKGSNELDIRCDANGDILEDDAQIALTALQAFATIEDAEVLHLDECQRRYNQLQMDDLV